MKLEEALAKLFLSCLYVNICIDIHVCVGVRAQVNTHMYVSVDRGQRSVSGILFNDFTI